MILNSVIKLNNSVSSERAILPVQQSNILIVDDDLLALKMHTHLLEKMGWENVYCFEVASQALEFVDSHPDSFDLILLDINMPEMDGIEFVHHLVDRNYEGATALISGESDRLVQSIVTLGRENGLTILGQIAKPVGRDSLQNIVKLWQVLVVKHPSTLAKRRYDVVDLQEAISRGELFNHYQPQVALKDGAFLGVETLVRWLHPEHGIVLPIDFIGLAEESGLIDDIARGVLARILLDARLWEQSGMRPQIAINLSPQNLLAPRLTDDIFDACKAAELDSNRLTIEVTESCAFRDRPIALGTLARLSLRRFGLSIDDFGTGYSCLSQLKDVCFSELKIDYRFVHGAANEPTKRAIFDASLALAINLDMIAVAEGVEDKDDWDFLRESSCHIAQGYFIGRPMPAGKLAGWLKEWSGRCEVLFSETIS